MDTLATHKERIATKPFTFNKTATKGIIRENIKGFQIVFPRFLPLEALQAERGTIPIRASKRANKGPVAFL
jgi:hypothetical protein